MQDGRTTLTQFIIEEQSHVTGATGDFTGLLNDIGTACKVISHLVNHIIEDDMHQPRGSSFDRREVPFYDRMNAIYRELCHLGIAADSDKEIAADEQIDLIR